MKKFLQSFVLICLLTPVGNQWVLANSDLVLPPLGKSAEPILPPEKTDPGPPGSATLDELFDKLRRESKSRVAKATAGRIWSAWVESGSPSINLLMHRAIQAMQENKSALAEDLLDHVVVLAPDYAEGWNRRATLYYTLSDFSRSIADIEVTLALEPRHFGALSGLAAILQRLSNDEQALKTWYKVLEIYPANKPAQNAVISLEEKLAGKRS